jgi:hypothetical protein
MNEDARLADGGEYPYFGGAYQFAFGEDERSKLHVLPYAAHVVTTTHIAIDQDVGTYQDGSGARITRL